MNQMLIQMKVTNKTENNCGVCPVLLPTLHTQTSHAAADRNSHIILCVRGRREPISTETRIEEGVESEQRLTGGSQRQGKRETDASLPESWQLTTSSMLSLWPLTLRVSLFITSHQLEGFQSTALTHRHTHTEREDQKVKGGRRSVKTSRDGWGSRKGTNMLDLKKGKGLEKDTRGKHLRCWRRNSFHLKFPQAHLSV